MEAQYLIPDADEVPLKPFECNVAGVNRPSRTGGERQDEIVRLREGQQIILIREPDNPHDPDAVALFTENGKDVGYLPREIAAEIASRLDKGSPVTAQVIVIEKFQTERGKKLYGVRIELTKYKMGRK